MFLLFIFALCFSGCRGNNLTEQTQGTDIIPTKIALSEKTEHPAIPIKTDLPQPIETITDSSGRDGVSKLANLSGAASISGKINEPLITTIELRGKDTIWLYKTIATDDDGRFEIHDIEPGDYELWVLITREAKIIPGCENVLVPNNQWHIGIKYQETVAMFGDISLQEAIVMSQDTRSSNLNPIGFYAVTPPYNSEIEPQKEIEIVLTCK